MMKRVTVRWAIRMAICLATGLLAAGNVSASDIICHSRGTNAPVICDDPSGNGMRCSLNTSSSRASGTRNRLVCDSPGLSERYERIYAEQQRMLHKGTIQNADIVAWRARRDACDSARCLDGLFHLFWRDRSSMHSTTAAAPHVAASAPSTGRHDAPPTPAAPAQRMTTITAPVRATATAAIAQPVRTTSFETPVAMSVARAPITSTTAVDISLTDSNTATNADESGPASLAWASALLALVITGTTAGVLWRRRHAYPPYRPPVVIPAAIVIVYALLLVNVLLLPFTLSLK